VGAQLQEVGDEKETTGTGGGQPAFEQGADIVFDLVTGDKQFAGLASAVEDFNPLLDQ
jgi:hypothetical protein